MFSNQLVKYMLNVYLESVNCDSFYFYKSFIGKYSLVSKGFRDIVLSLCYGPLEVGKLKQLGLVTRWIAQGVHFERVQLHHAIKLAGQVGLAEDILKICRYNLSVSPAKDLFSISDEAKGAIEKWITRNHLIASNLNADDTIQILPMGSPCSDYELVEQLDSLLQFKPQIKQSHRMHVCGDQLEWPDTFERLNTLLSITHFEATHFCRMRSFHLPNVIDLRLERILPMSTSELNSILESSKHLVKLYISPLFNDFPDIETFFTESLTRHPTLKGLEIMLPNQPENVSNIINYLNNNNVLEVLKIKLDISFENTSLSSHPIRNQTLRAFDLGGAESDFLLYWQSESNLDSLILNSRVPKEIILKHHCRVESLSIFDLLASEIQHTAELFAHLVNLRHLTIILKKSDTSDDRSLDIISAIKQLKHLKSVSLFNFPNHPVSDLVNANNRALVTVEFNNLIDQQILESLINNRNIRHLSLFGASNTDFTSQVPLLIELLKKNLSITKLSHNGKVTAPYIHQVNQEFSDYFSSIDSLPPHQIQMNPLMKNKMIKSYFKIN